MEKQKKITFKDLSWALKVPVVLAWLGITFWCAVILFTIMTTLFEILGFGI